MAPLSLPLRLLLPASREPIFPDLVRPLPPRQPQTHTRTLNPQPTPGRPLSHTHPTGNHTNPSLPVRKLRRRSPRDGLRQPQMFHLPGHVPNRRPSSSTLHEHSPPRLIFQTRPLRANPAPDTRNAHPTILTLPIQISYGNAQPLPLRQRIRLQFLHRIRTRPTAILSRQLRHRGSSRPIYPRSARRNHHHGPPLTDTTSPDPNTHSTTFTQPYQYHSHNCLATPHTRDHRKRRPPSNYPGQRHRDPTTFQPTLSTVHTAPSFDPASPESLPPRAVRIHTSLPPQPGPPAARREPTTGPTPSRRRRPTQYILFTATPRGRLQRRR